LEGFCEHVNEPSERPVHAYLSNYMELRNLNASLSIVRVMKSRKDEVDEDVARMVE